MRLKNKACEAGKMLGNAADAAAIARPMCHDEQETFVVLCMNIRNRLISAHVIALGTVHSVEVHPRDVFREAVKSNAAAVVLAHNHPTGDPTPSMEDVNLTKRLKEVGSILGIPVIDHVVITTNGFRSIAEILD